MMAAGEEANLRELEMRLGGTVPEAYRDFVASQEPDVLRIRGFDVKTLLVLNLELRSHEHIKSDGRFFLNGDDCGNYFFTELDAGATGVLLWSHDPAGIEDPGYLLAPYLQEATQLCRVDTPPLAGRLYVCRSAAFGESILVPIELDEWLAAVDAIDGVVHVGYREGRNPFTGKTMRFESPGLAKVSGAARDYVSFFYGRGELVDSPMHRAIAVQLAAKLHARVLGATDPAD